MSNTAIDIQNISKQYRLGLVSSKTISGDFKRWVYKMRGKEDPFLKIGDTNDRTVKSNSEYVWALRDISFKVKEGEVMGIIGLNGAGKSTLLKILSRVTTPTSGSIKIKGRMASLLEVGTGFHPELTGRENVFLNGAILGMSKTEIKSKFDEIVDFSGVERYIDTPVKRYSSGMYVRLAFAVAAHLEPEILVIDEVLAVGDAEFQKKCLGKMKDVATGGRTVLFVSHNMGAISDLCDRAVILKQGEVFKIGETANMVNEYINHSLSIDLKGAEAYKDKKLRRGSGKARIENIRVTDKDGKQKTEFEVFEPVFIHFDCEKNETVEEMFFKLALRSSISREIIASTDKIDISNLSKCKDKFSFTLNLDSLQLNEGIYECYYWLGSSQNENPYDVLDNLTTPLVIKKSNRENSFTGYTLIKSSING
ncbi:MAG: ABC transporter ATP-binding protein [Bacteroidetes bacterium]|nr:ABC transporter ATP-binding protein [Bacteroidota bacterium]